LRYVFDRRIEDFVASGMTSDEARRAARLEFGGLDQIKERCRDARGTRWFHDLLSDTRYALRLLHRDRAFAAVAIGALGLGIAVNNTQFTIVDGYCLRGLPIARADRVLFLSMRDKAHDGSAMAYADVEDVKGAATAFDEMAASTTAPVSLGDATQAAESATAAFMSVQALHLLGRAPAIGRDLRDGDTHPGTPLAVLVSHRMWQTRDADAAIVGRSVRSAVAGHRRHAGGVHAPDHADLWIPRADAPA
jgi:hypothetical protein